MPTKYPNGMRLTQWLADAVPHTPSSARVRDRRCATVIGAHAPIGAAVARAAVRITNAIGGAWSK